MREVYEETGHRAHLGRRLGTVTYPITRASSTYGYWAARAIGGDFVPTAEVDDLVWLPVADAMGKVSLSG